MSASEPTPSFTGNTTYVPIIPVYSHIGDFTPFYITITICSVLLGFLLILNIVCCCSRHSHYWLDKHTGNRWLVSLWTATPHKQPPLDLTELENQLHQVYYVHPYSEYETESREIDLLPSVSRQPLASSQEYLELHKRESDI